MADTRPRRPSQPGVTHNFAADDVLRGLPPELVILLARLAGDNLKDVSTTVEYMPYAYRAAMSAYGMIDMGKPHGHRPRLVKARPFFLEVSAAAANFIAALVDPSDVAAKIATETGGRSTPFVPVINRDDNELSASGAAVTLNAVVEPSDQNATGEWLLVLDSLNQVDATTADVPQPILIRSDLKAASHTPMHVTLYLPVRSLVTGATMVEASDAV